MAVPAPGFLDYFQLQADLIADPYPMYDRLRANDPVQLDANIGVWVLTRYAEVSAVLRDPRFSAERLTITEPLSPEWQMMKPAFDFISLQMLFRDPPNHTRLRGLVSKAFTPRIIETMRVTIQGLVDDLLDAASERGEMDIISDLAYPLPTTIIAMMLGIPAADRAQFKRWSDDFAAFLGTSWTSAVEGMLRSMGELTAYFHDFIPRRRGDEQDLLAALLNAEDQGVKLTQDEVLSNIILLLAAGHETTTNLIGNGTLALLRHPDQWQRLQAQPDLIPTAVEEFLRYDSPVQFTSRIAKEDIALGGQTVRRGQEVMTVLGAANRDPAQFPDPNRLDIGRRDNKHAAFGFGGHFCLGAPLARLEGQITFATLVRRLPNLRLADGAHLSYLANAAFRGLKSLPVTF